jgi:hypothetical protein
LICNSWTSARIPYLSPCVPNSPPILSLFYRPSNIRLFTSLETCNCATQTLTAINTQSTVSSTQFTFSLLNENFNNVLRSEPRSHGWPLCMILCNHKVTVRSFFSICPSYIIQNVPVVKHTAFKPSKGVVWRYRCTPVTQNSKDRGKRHKRNISYLLERRFWCAP